MPKPPINWIRNEDANLKAVIGSNGTLVGSPNFVAGRYGNCMEIDALNEYCQINLSDSFVNSKGAVSFDFKTPFSVTDGISNIGSGYPDNYWGMMDFRDSAGTRLTLGTGTDSFKTFWETTIGFNLYPIVTVSWAANKWHNLCIVWDRDGIGGGAKKFQWYINGTEVASSTSIWTASFSGTVTFIPGRRFWAGSDHQAIGKDANDGYIDNIKVWDYTSLDFKALSNRERYGMNDFS